MFLIFNCYSARASPLSGSKQNDFANNEGAQLVLTAIGTFTFLSLIAVVLFKLAGYVKAH